MRASSARWHDANGNFWLYGGHGNGITEMPRIGTLSDLWKYTPSTGLWTWVKGSWDGNIQGLWGTKGVGTTATHPGVRETATAFTDENNNLLLLCGSYEAFYGRDQFNDVWKYNPTTNIWTWINGDSTANRNSVFDTQGILSPSSQPGGRGYCFSTADSSGNIWMMGGWGDSVGVVSELWKYNVTTNQWAWVKDTLRNYSAGVYGTNEFHRRTMFPEVGMAGLPGWMFQVIYTSMEANVQLPVDLVMRMKPGN